MILKNPIETTNLKMDVFMMPDEDTSTASQVPRGCCGTGSVRTYPKNSVAGRFRAQTGIYGKGLRHENGQVLGSDSSFQD
jgi:hypothetical protein